MKAFDNALFMICFLLAINFLSASQVFGDTGVYYGDWAKRICDTTTGNCGNGELASTGVAPQQNEQLSTVELAYSAFGLLIRSLVAIILVFAYSTFLLPLFLGQLHLPMEVTAPVTTIVWLSYIIGYAQYRGRSTLQGTE